MVAAAAGDRPDRPRHVAFLRGINLGNRRLKMDELRGHFESLGLDGVATYLASGNVVFDHAGDDLAALEGRIEDHLEDALGYDVQTFVRPLADLADIPRLEPVVRGKEDGFNVHVIFLREEPGPSVAPGLRQLEGDDDRFHVSGREVLWLRRGRMTDAPFTSRDIEKALGGAANTTRNLNTVERIVAKFGPDD